MDLFEIYLQTLAVRDDLPEETREYVESELEIGAIMSKRVSIFEMDNYRDMLEELLAVEHGLSNREIEFLDNINDWDGCFTVPQADWLQKIYERLI